MANLMVDMRCPCCNQPLKPDGHEVAILKRLPAATRKCHHCQTKLALLASDHAKGELVDYYYTAVQEVARG